MDPDERVSAWNPAATTLFGYTPHEAIGRTIDDLILRSEALIEQGHDLARDAAQHGRAHRVGQRFRKDGTTVDVEILMVPLVVDGEHLGFYAIYHDSPSSRQRRGGRRREPGEERVPRDDEPRDPDADERRHRDDRAAARHAARRRAARLRREHQHVGRGAAHDHQRHPRLLEDRGRPVRAGVDRRSTCATTVAGARST